MWHEITTQDAHLAFQAIGIDSREIWGDASHRIIGHVDTEDLPLYAEVTQNAKTRFYIHESFYRQEFTKGFRPDIAGMSR